MNHVKIVQDCATAQLPTHGLADLSPRDKKWDVHRSATQTVGDIYDQSDRGTYHRLGDRMCKCANLLLFKESINPDTGEIGIKLKNAHFCHCRHCPICQWRKAMRNVARFFDRIPKVMEAHPKGQWLFLTLTVQNPAMPDLRKTLNEMNAAWKRLIERKDWPAIGYIRATEVTKDKNGNPHPHFHCLLLVRPGYFQGGVYLAQLDWAINWQSCLRVDYQPVIDVRKVKSKDGQAGIGAAVVETLKYAVKADDMKDPEFLYGITEQLRKMRFLATGGVLKNFLTDDDVSDAEMVNTTELGEAPEAVIDDKPPVMFGWKPNVRKYKKVSAPPLS
jgi:plasmid rolling circle replication initiator protein Rep